jgi:hypothetical protein
MRCRHGLAPLVRRPKPMRRRRWPQRLPVAPAPQQFITGLADHRRGQKLEHRRRHRHRVVALPDDPVVFGRVGLPQERHSVVVHRDGAVGGDVDFLAILHGVEEVAAELVDGDDLGVVPDVSEDDARC